MNMSPSPHNVVKGQGHGWCEVRLVFVNPLLDPLLISKGKKKKEKKKIPTLSPGLMGRDCHLLSHQGSVVRLLLFMRSHLLGCARNRLALCLS